MLIVEVTEKVMHLKENYLDAFKGKLSCPHPLLVRERDEKG